MNKQIQDNLVQLLDAYLDDLKSEADTVTHIVNYMNDSMTARAVLAEQLEAFFWTRENKTKVATAPQPAAREKAQIQGKAEHCLRDWPNSTSRKLRLQTAKECKFVDGIWQSRLPFGVNNSIHAIRSCIA